MPSPRPALSSSPRKTGRRVAILIFWTLVALVCVAGAAQVTRQVFFLPPKEGGLLFASCHAGLLALHKAVDRARLAAAGTEGEDAALARFRSALEPEWGHRDGVASRCKGVAADEATLDAIERLRYAEEHAVRREAGELAPLRRRVQGILDRELSPCPHGLPCQGLGAPGSKAEETR
jgi:hypothetical protein